MKKYKITYTLNNRVRVEDKFDGVKNFEAESMQEAIDKFFTFMKAFYGFRLSLKKVQVEEITK